jgi:hypothetical protein
MCLAMLDLKENKKEQALDNFKQAWVVYSSVASPLASVSLWSQALIR